MLRTAAQGQPKTSATTAAAMHKLHAVASAEQSAANVQFQWFLSCFPPHKNDVSADVGELPATQFSGCIAVFAEFAAFFAYCDAKLVNRY